MTKRKRTIIISAVVIMMLILIQTLWANKALELNCITVESEKLPPEFNGFRIAQVSDLHNTKIGKDNERLLAVLREAEPDIIVITGDMIDSRSTKVEVSLNFAEAAVEIASCYYVTGNHEQRVDEYDELKNGLINLGVTILEDEFVTITRGDDEISLLGVDDPSFHPESLTEGSRRIMDEKLDGIATNSSSFKVLLSHRPELFDVYTKHGIDLTLTGHAHGGQIRLPFLGGVIAPNQGFFPEYDSGLYTSGSVSMVVSRGVGNSIIPLRINNRPEVVLIELVG